MDNQDRHEPRTDVVASVLRACEVMSRFSPDRDLWTLAELKEATGLNRTTTYRLVNTLIEAGWIVRVDETHFGVDWRVYRIGASAYTRSDLRQMVRPHLQRLADTFGDTAYFMIPDDGAAICVDMVVGNSPLQIHGMQIGSRLPLNVAAAPIAMVAQSPKLMEQALSFPLGAYTEDSIVSGDKLRETAEEVRRLGYAVSRNDYLEGVSAVAAAVNLDGRLFGTISLGGSSANFTPKGTERRVEAVVAAAANLSGQVGNSPHANHIAPWVSSAGSGDSGQP